MINWSGYIQLKGKWYMYRKSGIIVHQHYNGWVPVAGRACPFCHTRVPKALKMLGNLQKLRGKV